MQLEITGVLAVKYDTVQVSEKFKKREFVVEIKEEINGQIYTETPKFQLSQARVDKLDNINVGQAIKVSFNLKGNKFEKNGKTIYMTTLDAWKIEKTN